MPRSFRRGVRPLAALISLAALACASLAGCASQSAAPSVSFPSPSAPPTLDLNATPSGSAGASAVGTFESQSVATLITAKITDSSGTVGTYPNGWETFTVVVSNASATAVANLTPLVVFGSCTCNPASGGVPPHTLLQIYDTAKKAWTPTATVSVNTGGSFTFERQAAAATVAAHGSLTYRFRMILLLSKTTATPTATATATTATVRNGTGSIQVYVMQEPARVRFTDASGPDASIALAYTVK